MLKNVYNIIYRCILGVHTYGIFDTDGTDVKILLDVGLKIFELISCI